MPLQPLLGLQGLDTQDVQLQVLQKEPSTDATDGSGIGGTVVPMAEASVVPMSEASVVPVCVATVAPIRAGSVAATPMRTASVVANNIYIHMYIHFDIHNRPHRCLWHTPMSVTHTDVCASVGPMWDWWSDKNQSFQCGMAVDCPMLLLSVYRIYIYIFLLYT